MAAYKNDFLQEVYECLDIFNQAFVDLENGDKAAINEIFRVAHTIKGMAGFLGYKSLETLCHSMEEVLCGIKNTAIEIDSNLIDLMLLTVDRITEMIKKIENEDNDDIKTADLLEAFNKYREISCKEIPRENSKLINSGSRIEEKPCSEELSKNQESAGEESKKSKSKDPKSIDEKLIDWKLKEDNTTCKIEEKIENWDPAQASKKIISLTNSKTEVIQNTSSAVLSLENSKDNTKDNPNNINRNKHENEEALAQLSDSTFSNITAQDSPYHRNPEESVTSPISPISSINSISSITSINSTGSEDYNLILNIVLSDDCAVKDVRASLIIESLKDICKVVKVSPDEAEMENNFNGCFTIFLLGNSIEVEQLMDKISEIEQFNIEFNHIPHTYKESRNPDPELKSGKLLENSFSLSQEMQNKNEINSFSKTDFKNNTAGLPGNISAEHISLENLSEKDISEKSVFTNIQDERYNLILNIILSEECVVKDVRASLIIESLKDISRVVKINPAEDDMDNNFDGQFTVFVFGDRNEVENLLDRIPEIEQYNIVCDEEIEYNPADPGLNLEENIINSQKDSSPILFDTKETADNNPSSSITEGTSDKVAPFSPGSSVPDRPKRIPSPVRSLIAKIHFIFKINKSLNGFKKIEFSGIFPGKKSGTLEDGTFPLHKIKLLDKNSNKIPEQELKLNNGQFLDQVELSNNIQFAGNVKTPEENSEVLSCQEFEFQRMEFQNLPVHESKIQELRLGPPTPQKSPEDSIPSEKIKDLNPEKLQSHLIEPQLTESQFLQPRILQASNSRTRDFENPEDDINSHFFGNPKSKPAVADTKRQETIRVSTSNLDNIMNLVGELVINKGRLLQISQKHNIPELEEATATLDKSISSLQDEVMRTRMVKIERIFSKFPRMVRDLSRKLDKNIDFEIEGQDTELDRIILDDISDPLVHLVRNAVDHGIESPDERKKAGKGQAGHIKLSAKREKNNVIIEIEDDGKGLDVEFLKKKALEKGLLSLSDIENLNEDEIRMLIFLPGFSTKEKVTEISGRGVGMDAVKATVEKLGGKVRVYSKTGEYTKIRINLPPTVAIIKSLLVEVGPETYAIPISNVVKALSVSRTDYKLVKGTPVLYINDRLIPVVELKEVFNVKCENSESQIAIVVEKENEEVGLIVDSIIDQQEIVIKPLTNIFSDLKSFNGVTILGDGRVIPILDVSMLIRDDIDD